MNLTGHWKGYYSYGKSYPEEYAKQKDAFEFDIKEDNGSFTGSCIDPVVKELPGNESYINGFFKDGIIHFKKRYRYHLNIDGELMNESEGVRSDGVDYSGKIYRQFIFFGKKYFAGEWSITSEYINEYGEKGTYTCGGKWKMSKAG